MHRRYRLLRHAGLRERKETREREPTTPIAYMVDRAGGARFGALSALHGFDVFIAALISKGGVARTKQAYLGKPEKSLSGPCFFR